MDRGIRPGVVLTPWRNRNINWAELHSVNLQTAPVAAAAFVSGLCLSPGGRAAGKGQTSFSLLFPGAGQL